MASVDGWFLSIIAELKPTIKSQTVLIINTVSILITGNRNSILIIVHTCSCLGFHVANDIVISCLLTWSCKTIFESPCTSKSFVPDCTGEFTYSEYYNAFSGGSFKLYDYREYFQRRVNACRISFHLFRLSVSLFLPPFSVSPFRL